MSTLDNYIKQNFSSLTEGHVQQESEQIEDLISLCSKDNIKSILEIGFNGGHSSEIFLKNNPSATVLSFDINHHPWVQVGKKYIDITFPNRHTLICGDSRITVPQYIQNNPNKKFDLIFIDGGHEYDVAKSDLLNCKKLAHQDTIVMIDDVVSKDFEVYNLGPTAVWHEYSKNNFITPINFKDYSRNRGMAWFKYNF